MNPLLNPLKKIWLNCIIFIVPTNSYGHPHKEVLERLREVGCKVLTTVDCGAVEIQVGQVSTGQMEAGTAEQKIIIRTWK